MFVREWVGVGTAGHDCGAVMAGMVGGTCPGGGIIGFGQKAIIMNSFNVQMLISCACIHE